MLYENADKHYRMNPKTEDLLAHGEKLVEGMIVLAEDSFMRVDRLSTGEFMSPYDETRYLENNRWCVVTELSYDRRGDGVQVSFVGLYEDGTKAKRTYGRRWAWLYKIDPEDGSALIVDDPQSFIFDEQSYGCEIEVVPTNPLFRVSATYMMMGDLSGEDWCNTVFSHHEEVGNVRDYQFLISLIGAWGLEYVTFTVDVVLDDKIDGLADLDTRLHQKVASLIHDSAGETSIHGYQLLEHVEIDK